MTKFEIIIDKRALSDIQQAVEYYNTKSDGLGIKFKLILEQYFDIIKINPFFQERYENIRCLPLKKFPYMLHFTVNEVDRIVKVHGILHTYRNPDVWKSRI